MKHSSDLREKLHSIDRKGYSAYKSLRGSYAWGQYTLHIDHVQSDPFAPPSRMRVRVDQKLAGLPVELYANKTRKVAVEDFLTRQFARAIGQKAGNKKGSGKSGVFDIDRCGQEILERTAMVVNADYVEARFVIGLPARGRTVMAKEAASMFFDVLPQVVNMSLMYQNLDGQRLKKHVEIAEDQDFMRRELAKRDLETFIGNGAILPRESGISDRPLKDEKVVPFRSPQELEVSFKLPNGGTVTGMGITSGVTLIVGGGYHGKSTLLRAIERGVYNHIPGDGREMVVTNEGAVKIRAEDGRSVTKVDIGAFISELPYEQDTSVFSSDNASGSTSQAANIVEALEVGSDLLLLDEDTSATNFMIRDGRMQLLVAKENEPITPFIDRVCELSDRFGVSTILVVGGSGDYFEVADRVIMMHKYSPRDVTTEAKRIAKSHQSERTAEVKCQLTAVRKRAPEPQSFKLDPKGKVKAKGLNNIIFGRADIDLTQVEQLVDSSQTNAIAEILRYCAIQYVDGERQISEIIDKVLDDIDTNELDVISPFRGQHPGDLALPRKHEIAAAFNRFRKLRIVQV
ncbi:MAG: ATPase [Firmicutes bacterium]|nr:ATPase [Bacillota bacterium]